MLPCADEIYIGVASLIEEKIILNNNKLYIILNILISCPGLRSRTLNKAIYIQRRLAWSLRKDDTQNRREQTTFLPTITLNETVWCSSFLPHGHVNNSSCEESM